MKCPICHNELINIYQVGWAHPAYSDNCFDGLTLAEKKSESGLIVRWFEVNDIEGRAYFLKKIGEIEKLEGIKPKVVEIDVQKPPEKPNKEEIEDFAKEVDLILTNPEKELKSKGKRYATRFKEVFEPYYEEEQKRLE